MYAKQEDKACRKIRIAGRQRPEAMQVIWKYHSRFEDKRTFRLDVRKRTARRDDVIRQ